MQIFQVVGVHVRSWDEKDELGHCLADRDLGEARKLAETLKIDLLELDCIESYWNSVFDPFILNRSKNIGFPTDQYCNSKIKFGDMLKKAARKIDFDYFATGHYAQTAERGNFKFMTQAEDQNKDQTFYLSQLTEDQIKQVKLAPI